MSSKPFAESCLRNQAPILVALRPHVGHARNLLEIGSGTGQHAVHFAAAMPWLRWQCSDHADHLPGIQAWLDEAGLPNTPAPIALQAHVDAGLTPVPQKGPFDAAFSANTLHIMGWDNVQALFAGLPPLLTDGAVLAVYGPFNYQGSYTSDSNRDFDTWLKARDLRSGIRDAEAVDALAAAHGFTATADLALPANNRLKVWRYQRSE